MRYPPLRYYLEKVLRDMGGISHWAAKSGFATNGLAKGFCRAKFRAKFPFWRGAVRGEVFREVCREMFHEVFGLVCLGHSEQNKLQQKL